MTALQAGTASARIRQTVEQAVRTVLERDVDPALDVFDQGATSLAFIRIVAMVNEEYGIEVDVAELEEASVEALAALVARQLGESRESETAEDGR